MKWTYCGCDPGTAWSLASVNNPLLSPKRGCYVFMIFFKVHHPKERGPGADNYCQFSWL